jgi:hypothetical protein
MTIQPRRACEYVIVLLFFTIYLEFGVPVGAGSADAILDRPSFVRLMTWRIGTAELSSKAAHPNASHVLGFQPQTQFAMTLLVDIVSLACSGR